ncbi:addiction module toxin RelE [Helicobacter sp. 12S02634-8]|uniref:type II toxin-antitoxin system YafQ family toxin n=1 Tax=Helicobacter sp. 12S02634-8 TaxID=1476199 RepID=UPI000BA69467|nr:type II toxin-antitoxin system YafQ family toxin [Helicobacter sp. 12S02634-8]PAF47254.1 addiction module toxin RelE [Helicobacter sp. 12S02634-8]
MPTIKLTKSFKKSYKKLSEEDKNIFKIVLEKLANNEVLDKKYRDHSLMGKLKKYRECHLRPDLLLIYQKQQDGLILICIDIGKHSDLFG